MWCDLVEWQAMQNACYCHGFDIELLGRAWCLPWTEGQRTEYKINLSFGILVVSQKTEVTAFVNVENSVKVNWE